MAVISIRIRGKLCSDCEHAYMGSRGVFCGAYQDLVENERVAEECGEFDPVPWGSTVETWS